jgi:hypothetical protein
MGQGQNIRSEVRLIETIRSINEPFVIAAEQARAKEDEKACRWAAQVLDYRMYREYADHDISRGFDYARKKRFDISRFHFNRAIKIINKKSLNGRVLQAIGQAFPHDCV